MPRRTRRYAGRSMNCSGGGTGRSLPMERCASLTDKPGRVEELCQMGAYIQVNAESILGEIGRGVKAFCVKLIRNDLVHFVATDAHNETDRAPNLKQCVQYLTKKFGDDTVRELLIHNPMKMIHNEYI